MREGFITRLLFGALDLVTVTSVVWWDDQENYGISSPALRACYLR
jgi:hypothetical protein